MKKLEKIDRQEQKAREQLAALHALLKEIDGKRTEQENLQIVQQIRALKLSRDELYSFLSGGELPPALAGALGGTSDGDTAAEPEQIYSQNNRKRRNKRNSGNEPDTGETEGKTEETTEGEPADHEGNPYGNGYNADTETTHFESEGMNHEEQ